MFFKDIPGNKVVKTQLINSIKNNRISHAQIFSGSTGSAKLALSLAYARYLNCENRFTEDSCGKCTTCLKYNSLSHPDLHLIFPVLKLAGNKISISDNFVDLWRNFILKNTYGSLNGWIDTLGLDSKKGQKGEIYKDEAISIHKKLTLKNFSARYRVVLIWMPEQMNIATSNKLLKLFEEPPNRVVFLLVSENPKRLLPTITSRLQKTEIKDFSADEMFGFFKNNVSLEKIKELRHLTNADLGKMIQLTEGGAGEADVFNDFSTWMRLAYKIDVINISRWVDSVSSLGRKYQETLLSYAIKMMRECVIFNFANKSLLKCTEKESEFVSRFSLFIHEENTVIIVETLEKAIRQIKRNANAKILFFELSLQIVKFLKVKRKFVIN